MAHFNQPVNLIRLEVENDEQDIFRQSLVNIPYLLYEVEQLSDGKKIVINKPGGKRSFGRLSQNDIMVFIYDAQNNNDLWLISHNEIYTDLVAKAEVSPEQTISIINGLYLVCNGQEPDEVIGQMNLVNPCGLSPELIFKVYKWIWGQEDCNYPTGQGRWLSMNTILELRNEI